MENNYDLSNFLKENKFKKFKYDNSIIETIDIKGELSIRNILNIKLLNKIIIFILNIIFIYNVNNILNLNKIWWFLIISISIKCYFEINYYFTDLKFKNKKNYYFWYNFWTNISYIIFCIGIVIFNKHKLFNLFFYLPNLFINIYLNFNSFKNYNILLNKKIKLIYCTQLFFIYIKFNFINFEFFWAFIPLIISLILSLSLTIILIFIIFINIFEKNINKNKLYNFKGLFYLSIDYLSNLFLNLIVLWFIYYIFEQYKNNYLIAILLAEIILLFLIFYLNIIWKKEIYKFYKNEKYYQLKEKKIILKHFKSNYCNLLEKISENYFIKTNEKINSIEKFEENLCIICYVNESDFLCYPCNHLVFCQMCCKNYIKLKRFICPICKKIFLKIYKIKLIENNIYKIDGQLFLKNDY